MARRVSQAENVPSPGTLARNEMDTRADTCCAGPNWRPIQFTGDVCEVTPFLDSYEPVPEIPVAQCATVWRDPWTLQEFLVVADQMLFFGTLMSHSLINPNQIRAFDIPVDDNPFTNNGNFGISHDEAFIPFDVDGTVVYFESRSPTDRELDDGELPVMLMTASHWDPTADMITGKKSHEAVEMNTIRSLTSGMTRRQVSQLNESITGDSIERNGEVDRNLAGISSVFDEQTFCKRMINSVHVATDYREDIDSRNVNAMHSDNWHSKVNAEELAQKWNIGLQAAKDTMQATTQHGIRTAIHPMTKRLRVDHLHLHRKRLPRMWHVNTVLSKVKSLLQNTCANIYTQGKFTRVIPMTSRADSGLSLIEFTDDVGIPDDLMTDGAGEFTGRNTVF